MAIYRVPPPPFIGGSQPSAPATHPPSGPVVYNLSLPATNAEAASTVKQVGWLRSAIDAQQTVLTAFGLRFRVLPASDSQAAAVQKSVGVRRVALQAEVAFLVDAFHSGTQNLNKALALASTEAAALLRLTAKLLPASSTEASASQRMFAAFRSLPATNAEAASTVKQVGWLRSAVEAQAVVRSLLVSSVRGAVSAQHAVLAVFGAHPRVFAATDTEATALQQQTGKILAFSRSSPATYFDITGTLQTAPANVPRFGFDPITHAPLGLIVEAATTNIAWPSSPGTGWNFSNGSATANNAVAPDGTTTATKLAFNAISTGIGTLHKLFPTTSTTYTLSIWLKGAVGGEVLYLIMQASTFLSTQVTLTTSWQRYTFTALDNVSSTFFSLGWDSRDPTETFPAPAYTIYAWGAQFELGSTATSFIPTTTAPASRAADTNFGAADPEAASLGLMLSASRLLAALQGQATVALALRALGVIGLTTQGQVMSRKLTASVVRRLLQPGIASVAAVAGHFRSLAVAQAEAVSRLAAITRVRLLSALQVQIAAAAEAFTHAGINTGLALSAIGAEVAAATKMASKVLSVFDAPATALTRFGLHPRALTTTNAQAAARVLLVSIARGLVDAQATARTLAVFISHSAVDAQVVSRKLLASITRGVVSTEATARSILLSVIRRTTNAQVVAQAVSTIRSKILAAIDAQLAFLVEAFAHAGVNTGIALSAASAEAGAMLRSAAKSMAVAVASPGVAAFARLVSRLRSLVAVSPDTSALRRQTGRVLAAAGPSFSSLQRLISIVRSASLVFSRTSPATYFDANGTLQTAGINIERSANYNPTTLALTGPLLEAASTNWIRNPGCEGSTAGVVESGGVLGPGLMPTFWGSSSPTLTITLLGTGSENGIPFVDLSYSGTASTQFIIAFDNSTGIPALQGQTWTVSAYVKLLAGSWTNVTNVSFSIREFNSSAGNIASSPMVVLPFPTGAGLATQQFNATWTLPDAATASIRCLYAITPAGAVSFTVRIGGAQAEQNAVPSSLILPPIGSPGASSRAADIFIPAGAQVAALSSPSSRFLGALATAGLQAASLPRQIGHLVSAAEAQASALAKAIGAVRHAVAGQSTARALAIGRRLTAASAQASSLLRLRTIRQMLAALQAQIPTATQLRDSGAAFHKLLSSTSADIAGFARGVARVLGVASPSIASKTIWYHRFLPLALRRRVVRLPPARDISTLPRSIRRIVLPPPRQAVMLPGSIRRVVLPREEDELSDYEIHRPEPAFFSPFDPADEETFTFDWSRRGYPNDTIVFASVTSVPAGVNFLGPAFIDGALVEVTIGPFLAVPSVQPVTYDLRCMAVFASGRISNYSVPFQVKTL